MVAVLMEYHIHGSVSLKFIHSAHCSHFSMVSDASCMYMYRITSHSKTFLFGF